MSSPHSKSQAKIKTFIKVNWDNKNHIIPIKLIMILDLLRSAAPKYSGIKTKKGHLP